MKTTRITGFLILICSLLLVSNLHEAAGAPEPVGSAQGRAIQSYGKLPLSFERNQGQAAGEVKFLARWGGRVYWFTPNEMVLDFPESDKGNASDKLASLRPEALLEKKSVRRRTVRISFPGANTDARVEGIEQQPGRVNYFIGNDQSKWRTNVPTYREVVYRSLWQGIDLRYEGRGGNLKYEFVVAPGADPGVIRMAYAGAESLRVSDVGELVIATKIGDLKEARPVVYQVEEGQKKEIAGSYRVLENNQVDFLLGEYDRSLPLVIDPLVYSTYLGGASTDAGIDIAVDNLGCAYVVGYSMSSPFPTASPYDASLEGVQDAFVSKFDASGATLVFSTYLGGNGSDTARGVAVDASRNVYVTGSTYSTNFPRVNAYQTTYGGSGDAFLTKLHASGATLLYSTYLGGCGTDEASGIAVDYQGKAYLTGYTKSTDFPTTALAFQGSFQGGNWDAFVTRFDASGLSLSFSTYLGGNGDDFANEIALYKVSSQVGTYVYPYVTGSTTSTDFPTAGTPYQGTKNTGRDAFVTKFQFTGQSLIFSTYLGGSGNDYGQGIAVDSSGNAFVTGYTSSTNFPVSLIPNPFQQSYAGGGYDAFVTKLYYTGQSLLYSTYLGGSGQDTAWGIALDTQEKAYVVGQTLSTDFPVSSPFQPANAGGVDAFVTRLDSTFTSLISSTYLGGTYNDYGYGIALDYLGNAYVTGVTHSANFPTELPYQATNAGNDDVFVTKLSYLIPSPVYRFWSQYYTSHHYTIDEAEKNFIIANWPTYWTYEGPGFYAFTTQQPATLPVYRFWSQYYTSHHYTIDEAEKNFIIANWAAYWTYEGVAFYAYIVNLPGTRPVYRFWSQFYTSHHWTISEAEKNMIISTWPDYWTYEGVAFYAHQTQ